MTRFSISSSSGTGRARRTSYKTILSVIYLHSSHQLYHSGLETWGFLGFHLATSACTSESALLSRAYPFSPSVTSLIVPGPPEHQWAQTDQFVLLVEQPLIDLRAHTVGPKYMEGLGKTHHWCYTRSYSRIHKRPLNSTSKTWQGKLTQHSCSNTIGPGRGWSVPLRAPHTPALRVPDSPWHSCLVSTCFGLIPDAQLCPQPCLCLYVCIVTKFFSHFTVPMGTGISSEWLLPSFA